MDPEQQAAPQTPIQRPPARTAGLVSLDVLPARYRRSRPPWSTIAAWLALVALLALLYPTAQWFAAARDEFDLASRHLAEQQETLTAGAAPSGTEAALQTQIAALQDQTGKLNQAAESVSLQQVAWGETIQFALSLAPEGSAINQIDQTADSLELTGTAQAYDQALGYARRLEATGRFATVQVEIISHLVESTPTAAPTAGRTARTPTPTATPAASGLFGFRITLTTRLSNLATPLPEVTDAP